MRDEAVAGLVAEGEAALETGDWERATNPFQAALADGELPEAFDGLGRAMWWAGQVDDANRSVVTEARRPEAFEFVTEAWLSPKRGGRATAWILVNRYEIARVPEGCRVTYRSHVTRLAPATLYARVRPLRWVAIRISKVFMRRGLRNLTRFVEEGAAERSAA